MDLQQLIKELKDAEDLLNATPSDIGPNSSYGIQYRKVNRLTAKVEEAREEARKESTD